MRSIPFKALCMLGLNEGAYPRPVQGQSFDLLTLTPSRIGDRSRREDDRYLFLEALSSARSHLYISYCGRDIQDNSERYPSILVTELQNYCAENFTLEGRIFEQDETILNHCLVEHHLQPFNQDYYFNEQSIHGARLDKTFATEWLPLINPRSQMSPQKIEPISNAGSTEEEQFDLFGTTKTSAQVSLDFERLLDCASHPLRYYYRTALQVNLKSVGEEMISSEPFSIQGLAAYDLKKDLALSWFDDHINFLDSDQPENNSFSGLAKRWQLSGKLPRAPLDNYYMANIQASLRPMYDYVCQHISNESIHHDLDLNVEHYQVSGGLVSHGNQLVEIALSKNLGSSFFNFWIKHIFWSLHCSQVDGLSSIESRLIGPENEVIIPVLSKEQADTFALQCCQFFELASSKASIFFPKSTYSLLFESEAKAKGAFIGNQNVPGENADLYWQRFCLIKNSSMQANEELIDWQTLPDLENSILFKQIDSIKESIQINKVELNLTPDKQANVGVKVEARS